MKKMILCAMIALLAIPTLLQAQTYDELWAQSAKADYEDLPQTQRKVLGKIIKKAEQERCYGQLIKALLTDAQAAHIISPDSLPPAVERLKHREQHTTDGPLRAVYQAVLSHLYSDNSSLDEQAWRQASKYARAAMSNPKELAAVKASDYEPFVVKGIDSRIYDNDLLSVIGYETRQFKALHSYYLTTENRPAQLLTAVETATGDKHQLDSLIAIYGDLPECGEAAIERYHCMQQDKEATAREKMTFIDDALNRWGSWKRMNELRNERAQLTSIKYHAEMNQTVVIPNSEQTMRLHNLRGVKEMTLRIYRVKVDGDTRLDPTDAKDYKTLKPLLTPLEELTQTRHYDGKQEYEVFSDTIVLPGLPVGVYMLEMESMPKTNVGRSLYFVSDVRILTQGLPQNQIRYVVVNATTGQPHANAKLRLTTITPGNEKREETVTCNGKGEYLHTVKDRRPSTLFATTKDDRFCPTTSGSGNFSYRKGDPLTEQGNVFVDRAIYRPGQTVHACAIIYSVINGFKHKAKKSKEVKAVLRDANYKVIKEYTLVTDTFGTVACDFTLPSSGLNGEYQVSFDNYRRHFRVEEYKRPTFQVEIPKPQIDYRAGDTLTVRGTAKSYAGVPVQGAKVSYRVERRQAWWWLSYSRYWRTAMIGEDNVEQQLYSGETTTDADGNFDVRMPMVMPDTQNPMFCNFVVVADVTDPAGETHPGELSLPLSNRKAALSVDLPEKMLREEMPKMTFRLRNAAGTDLDGEVRYRIDNGKWLKAKTSTPLALPNAQLKSGKHLLEAICNNDTIKQDFIVFALDDKRPATETDEWFYVSDKQFPTDGKPVTLQVGSSAKDVHIVYTIVSGNTVIESGAVNKSNELINRKFTYKDEYENGLTLSFAWMKEGKTHQNTTTIRRPLPDKQLRLKWETFRDRLTPGQQEEWTLKVEAPEAPGSSTADTQFSPLNVQLLATLYDKSLDQIAKHDWYFTPFINLPLPSLHWFSPYWYGSSFYGHIETPHLEEKSLSFSRFNRSCFTMPWPRRRYEAGLVYETMAMPTRTLEKGAVLKANQAANDLQTAIGAFNTEGTDESADANMKMRKDVGDTKAEAEGQEVKVRENLQETAFFYPQLMADSTGIVTIKFTLPESLTTWRFLGLAHTPDMMYGSIESEAVAKKDVMIQPNMPRFVRMGDEAAISARIINTCDKAMDGTARLTLSDPESNNVIYEEKVTCLLEANSTLSVTFHIPSEKLQSQDASLLVCKTTVSGTTFGDGEQHYLPILPNKQQVTVTVPFTQTTAGTKSIDLQAIVPANSTQGKLTFEYTNNPAWLMIQALHAIGHPHDNCAICQAASLYANTLGQHILKQNPQAKHVFEMWKQESASSQPSTLSSQLEKNEELKDLLLNETPWVMDADRESEQRQRLADFFDTNLMDSRLNGAMKQLQKLQNGDGSWSWWEDMPGSLYMTTTISEMLVRLNKMTGTQKDRTQLLNKSFKFMDNEILELVAEMKRQEKKGFPQDFPSYLALEYLYLSALDGRSPSAKVKDAQNYLKKLLKKEKKRQTLYEKALSAIILNAPAYVKSLKEYTVYKEDMGRYYDSPRAGYSWRDYRIPTQVAAIEAIQQLTPNDSVTIDEMRRWLLQEKRTQAWDTPINSTDAIYAFLNGNSQALKPQPKTVLKVDGNELETSEATAGLGYVKTAMPAKDKKLFTAEKTSTGTSWGAVYAQFMQHTADIADQGSEISVRREYRLPGSDTWQEALDPQQTVHVGNRLKVRITIQAQRDLDFVEVVDRRAACMEPINQLSGYRNGYYCSPKDNATHYFFDCLRKGKRVIETEYYIDREGSYETGTCTAGCAYAPEFRATTHSVRLKIED